MATCLTCLVHRSRTVTVALIGHRFVGPLGAAMAPRSNGAGESLDGEIAELDAHLDELTTQAAPTLRTLNGVGPQNAAALLAAAGDNPDRLRSAASFAALCGTCPIDASSGRQQRHRLNRGGDRQANCALYHIVMSLRWHQPTKNYMVRRTAEGHTSKEIIRCLKRYVAIEVHRAITTDLGTNITAQPTRIAA
jgi:transposase